MICIIYVIYLFKVLGCYTKHLSFMTMEAHSFATDADRKQIEIQKLEHAPKQNHKPPKQKNLKPTQTSPPKNDVEPEDRRRKRARRVYLLPSKGKRAKPHRKRNDGAEEGDPRRTTNRWSYMTMAGLDLGREEKLIDATGF